MFLLVSLVWVSLFTVCFLSLLVSFLFSVFFEAPPPAPGRMETTARSTARGGPGIIPATYGGFRYNACLFSLFEGKKSF